LGQGLSGLTVEYRNILAFVLPVGIGLVFLWKAPVALSVYWGVNSLLGFAEKKILSMKVSRNDF